MEKKEVMIINDPVHKTMNFNCTKEEKEILKKIINNEKFQRLRRILQLGHASYVFPGATHSRFSHSLGTAYLASLALDHLSSSSDNKINKEDRFKIILNSLLHDVGHGPFSHSFEEAVKRFFKDSSNERKDKKLGELEKIADHEEWTRKIKSSIEKESRFNLSDYSKSSNDYFDQLISSQLDVDRMDYLLRDSHFSGTYLGCFDVGYLINCLSVIKHKNIKILGIKEKGVRQYESFILARQLMNRTVYYHHKVKVVEYMFERFIVEVIKKAGSLGGLDIYPKYFKSLYNLRNSENFGETELEKFMKDNLYNYLNLTDDSIYTLLKFFNKDGEEEINRLSKKILKREIYLCYPILEDKEHILKKELEYAECKRSEDFDIIELKSNIYKDKNGERVFVETEKEIKSIKSLSRIVQAFSNQASKDCILVVLNENKKQEIEDVVEKINNVTQKEINDSK